MFFAPPKVKSLSRYAEFGIYFGHKHFMAMLGIAIIIHAIVIGIYAMIPREEVIKIPVRVLNIKLSGGGSGHVVIMPSQSSAPPAEKATAPQQSQHAKAEHPHKVVVTEKSASRNLAHSQAVEEKYESKSDSSAVTAAESTMDTPKKYVRESEMASDGKGQGLGGGNGTGSGKEEIVQRYEQQISLWIAQHKTYPEAAKRQGIEGDAIIRIRIDRAGNIIYNSIDRSSGNALIDQAVSAMVYASNPVPRVPADYPDGGQFEFLIPVSFRLQ